MTSVTDETITTQGVGQATAIANIKNVLVQNKAVYFWFVVANQQDANAFYDFWGNNPETAVWNPDQYSGHQSGAGGFAHAVLVVGYDDTNPSSRYWIILNSWGTGPYNNRPNGLFRMKMDINYDDYFYAPPYAYYSLYWQTLAVNFSPTPVVSTDKTTYAQGELIQFSGTAFTPGGSVLGCLSTDNDGSLICSGGSSADGQGNVAGTMQVGTNIPVGPQKFVARDVSSASFSNGVQLTITITQYFVCTYVDPNNIGGSFTLNGVTYTDGQRAPVLADGTSYALVAGSVTNYQFHHWSSVRSVHIANSGQSSTSVWFDSSGWDGWCLGGITLSYSSAPLPPTPSYPSDRWERLWYVYSGTPSSPWGQYLGSGPEESNLDFDNYWGSGTLAYSRSDMIGFVSSRTVNIASGTWTFTVVSDDGVRLYVDDQLAIDAWEVQPPTTYTHTQAFASAADHRLRLEYFENQYGAKLSFNMQAVIPPPSPSYPSDRWQRLWYVFSGTPSSPWGQYLGSGPEESNLNFDNNWGSGVLAYGRSDYVGFVSSRTVDMASGKWTFTVVSDDGVRLYIDGQLAIDAWKIQAPTTYTYAQPFDSAGSHQLRLEYFENAYGAKLSFNMQAVIPPPSPSYPTDRWERLWYVYSGSPSSPWDQYLGSGPDESNLNFDTDWGSGTVAYSRSDRVGFISSRTVNIAAGTWTFTVVSDDGVRLYIDEQLVIDAWKVQPPTTYTYTRDFASTGDHQLRLEWFENEYGAKLCFNMQGVIPPPSPSYPSDRWERLWYTYSAGSLTQFLGSGPDESNSDFDNDWSSGILGYGRSDRVGFISSRTVDMASGKWTFTVVSDDGVRLYIDDQLVIDAWKVQPPTTYTYSRTFDSAAAHRLRLEYFENEYGAKLGFNMQVEAPPPTPSYPSDRWERLWYVYSGTPGNPWGQYLGHDPSLDEPNLTFDNNYGSGSIAYGRSDRIGFISSRTVNVAAGTWIFMVISDDGVRLYVDDQLVIDGWKVQPPTTYTHTQTFASTADHHLRLEWFENEYGARVAFDMQQAGAEVGLKGEYYSSSSPGAFTAKVTERVDSTVYFDWGDGSPAPGVPSDLFAVRWTGSLTAPASGTYTIYVTADDGVRVWIDGNLVIDAWKVQPPTEYSWTGPLSNGKHTIKIEYYENYYGAVMKLGWMMPNGTKVYPIPSSYLSPT
jgi:hypothetical protein